MPLKNEFDEDLRAKVARNIPCVHMPGLLLAEKALLVVKEYLIDAKNRGLVSIDEVLEDMKVKNGQSEN
ncbi:MAG: hypothetical protein ACO3UU_02300 [Minisyncoccia bacterium]